MVNRSAPKHIVSKKEVYILATITHKTCYRIFIKWDYYLIGCSDAHLDRCLSDCFLIRLVVVALLQLLENAYRSSVGNEWW